jgi:hypothetical protein
MMVAALETVAVVTEESLFVAAAVAAVDNSEGAAVCFAGTEDFGFVEVVVGAADIDAIERIIKERNIVGTVFCSVGV